MTTSNDKPAKPKPDPPRCLALRQAGASVPEIAAQLGTTRRVAQRALNKALARLQASHQEQATLAVTLESQRLDFVVRTATRLASDAEAPARDRLKACQVLIAATGARQRLLGIGAPLAPAPAPIPEPPGPPAPHVTDADRIAAITALLARAKARADAANPALPRTL
jgi:hypothetical protein